MVRLTIDGQSVDAPTGTSILQAAKRASITVPTLCHDERLAPSGACRVCVVAIDGVPHPVAACTTPVSEGTTVDTRTPALEDLRRTLLALLAADRPAAFTDDGDGEAALLARRYGVQVPDAPEPEAGRPDRSHPLIDVDMSQCITCFRCVRICDEVQGQFVWRAVGRGASTRIVAGSGGPLAESDCVGCGACVDTCPTNALTDRSSAASARPDSHTRSVCPYCGVGCEIDVGTRDGRIVGIAAPLDAPVNRGHLCVKGRYGSGFVTSPDRLTRPLVRDADGLRPATWDEAIDLTAGALRRVLDRHGPSAVGVLGSARTTNEENYLVQKLARAVLGTNNVDSCARVCHAPSAEALRSALGTGASTNSFDDIERARTLLVCGSNTTENHPVVGARIKQAALAGAKLVVIDARRVELADHADVFLQIRPGTNVALLNAMARTILDDGLVDDEYVAARVDGLAAYSTSLAPYAPEVVEEICGVAPSKIRDAAHLYASATPSMSVHGLGVTEHHQGTDGVTALINLALLTGNLGVPGAGVNPLRGQNNVQGAAHMGCEPSHLTGYAPIDAASTMVGAVWGRTVPTTPGLDAMQMIDAAASGTLRALLVVGWDIALTQPNASVTNRALAELEFVAVQDLFVNETVRRHATVVLPAAASFEKDGTFMNSERRVQRVRQAVEPPGDALPDWQITARLAQALGASAEFAYRDTDEIWEEIRRVWPAGAGITSERLDAPGGVQWPCPHPDHPGTRILHTDRFAGSRRAELRVVEHRPPRERSSDDLPFTLITGRLLHQFNSATMTSRTDVAQFHPTDVLQISPVDAELLHLHDGQVVQLRSTHGRATLPIEISARVLSGHLFTTFSDPAVCINQLTGDERDPFTNTPAYKVTAAAVEPLPATSRDDS
ncbi:MAG TPA: formate dehydrogenase subunit alpha [Microthrixaceae bacterium]|nr:formate dehydrogenase subunit alpha [Microthrixaceae bacterium]